MRQVRRLHLPLVCLQVQGVLQVRRGGGGDLRDVLGDISTNELTVLQEGSRSLGGHSAVTHLRVFVGAFRLRPNAVYLNAYPLDPTEQVSSYITVEMYLLSIVSVPCATV
jgi:hypothetical protein